MGKDLDEFQSGDKHADRKFLSADLKANRL